MTTPSMRRPRPLYTRYNIYADGKVYILRKGVDFAMTTRMFVSALNRLAADLSMVAQTRTKGKFVMFRIGEKQIEGLFEKIRPGHVLNPKSRDPERLRILQQFANRELSSAEVEKSLGVSRQRIYQLIKILKLEMAPRKKKTLEPLTAEDIELYRLGKVTLRAVADKLGLSLTAAWDRLIANGICCERKLVRRENNQPQFVLSGRNIDDYVHRRISVDGLTERLGCSRKTTVKLLRKRGLVRKRRDSFALTDRHCELLRTRIVTIREMARRTKVSSYTIRTAMTRQGVDLEKPMDSLPEATS